MNKFMQFSVHNSHLPIKYHLSFYNWLMANNLANGKWQMDDVAGGDL